MRRLRENKKKKIKKFSKILKILDYPVAEVIRKKYYHLRCKNHIPGFFVIFFYMSTYLFISVLDKAIIAYLFLQGKLITALTYLIFVLLPVIFSTSIIRTGHKWSQGRICRRCCFFIFNTILVLLGLDAILNGVIIFKRSIRNAKSPNFYNYNLTAPFLIIPKCSWFKIKSSGAIYALLRDIPLLVLISIALSTNTSWSLQKFYSISYYFHSVAYSFSMAIIFPIQEEKKIYSRYAFGVFSSLAKFLSSMCACYIICFGILNTSISMYTVMAFCVYLLPIAFISCKCTWQYLRKAKVFFKCAVSACLSIYFMILYIHPFQECGILYYYWLHTWAFLFEVFILYQFTNINNEILLTYFSLRLLSSGYLACFGLVNLLNEEKKQKLITSMAEPTIPTPTGTPNRPLPVLRRISEEKF